MKETAILISVLATFRTLANPRVLPFSVTISIGDVFRYASVSTCKKKQTYAGVSIQRPYLQSVSLWDINEIRRLQKKKKRHGIQRLDSVRKVCVTLCG